jgi:membrane-associated phospholipid phosphatase
MPERARTALVAAAALAVLLIATWYFAFHVGIAERADQSILIGFTELSWRPRVKPLAAFVAGLCNPKPYVYLCAVPFVVAVARRRLWVSLAIVAILLGANVTTELLKPLLAAPRESHLLSGGQPPSPASWPSGHATAAMSLALSCVIAAPARLRPLAASLGAVFAVAVSYSFLTLEWHYPSDVLGGFLVATIWTLVAAAGVFTANDRLGLSRTTGVAQRVSTREALGAPSAVLVGALVLGALVALTHPREVVEYARAHEAFVIGAIAIGGLGFGLAMTVMLALRR